MASAAEQMAKSINFDTFSKAKDLQKRILFTLGILLIYRFGTFIPVPGIDPEQFARIFENLGGSGGGLFGNANMFSGGAIERMSIFALNVMPYITASIIVQMMTTASPTLSALKKEGEVGRQQINQYTRYLTVAFAVVQSFGISVGLQSSGATLAHMPGWFFILTGVVTLTGGTIFLMWIGEQVTARGIGNGVSLIIFAGIIAEMPRAIFNLLQGSQNSSTNPIFVIGIGAMVIGLVVFMVFVERAQRRLMIQYPKRQQGNRVMQGQNSFLPLKINTSGVIPPIFASAILLLPTTAIGFSSGGGAAEPGAATGPVQGALQWMAVNFGANTPGFIIAYGLMIALSLIHI